MITQQIQREYGNRYVQRIVAHIQRRRAEAAQRNSNIRLVDPDRQVVESQINDSPESEYEGDATAARSAVVPVVSSDLSQAPQDLRRWVRPGEDTEANRFLDNLDGMGKSIVELRTRSNELSTSVPAALRVHWVVGVGGRRIEAYQTASDIGAEIGTALRLAKPGTPTLDQLKEDVERIGAQFNTLRNKLSKFEADYAKLMPAIKNQLQQHGLINDVVAAKQGVDKLKQWRDVAAAIQAMNAPAIGPALAAFGENLSPKLFKEDHVEDARKLGDGAPKKQAVVQFLTHLFSTGQATLNVWSKGYPTNFDLRTGEFGAEWHVTSGDAPWLGKKWVFHAHCESIRDSESGNYEGFRFKPNLGANHLKMISEKMAPGVQLDLPLTPQDLKEMAEPYQEEFYKRFRDDSTFRDALKKAR